MTSVWRFLFGVILEFDLEKRIVEKSVIRNV